VPSPVILLRTSLPLLSPCVSQPRWFAITTFAPARIISSAPMICIVVLPTAVGSLPPTPVTPYAAAISA
jgi:hypothetical protein